MAFTLNDCTTLGPAFPEYFLAYELQGVLTKLKLLQKSSGRGRQADGPDQWEQVRAALRSLTVGAGAVAVRNAVLQPLVKPLGYETIAKADPVHTREGEEEGGHLFQVAQGSVLRVWSVGRDTDLDAPHRRGRAYRFSAVRSAFRVLREQGEVAGLLTDGTQLRLLIAEPARADSQVIIDLGLGEGWRGRKEAPDSFRLLVALLSPPGLGKLPQVLEAARLAQSGVTKQLRAQARKAIQEFVQEVLDQPANEATLAGHTDRDALARTLWHEGLVVVYRLLFLLKSESAPDPARSFSFASSSLWRNTFSPNTALGALVERRRTQPGMDTGTMLEDGLRSTFRLFHTGITSGELQVDPLGGWLFNQEATPLLESLSWGERAVERLLDNLLWTVAPRGRQRERIHYAALDVEDLGGVYESLLELEPGIATEPMARLQRNKLEVVLPLHLAEKYPAKGALASQLEDAQAEADEDSEEAEEEDDDSEDSGKKAKVFRTEHIDAGRFYLRVGRGRKLSNSFYTPTPFVRFLVEQTVGVLATERSPLDAPDPMALLALKVVDTSMGSGHFLVEVCRFLGDRLYEACRLCDERAQEAEQAAAETSEETEADRLRAEAASWRARVEALPDPNDEILAYLPSRASEGGDAGVSQRKAEALCRRLVAVHCVYGVDKNPLAVELAKLSLWLESYAEGLPLTFLDHRLVVGDSLAGPFFEHLLTRPVSRDTDVAELWAQDITGRLEEALQVARREVAALEASIGTSLADLERKEQARARLDAALHPLRTLARCWAGAVRIGTAACDHAYVRAAHVVAEGRDIDELLADDAEVRDLYVAGGDALSYDLEFPEVFHAPDRPRGFDVALGNPPWDPIQFKSKEFLASYDLEAMNAPNKELRKQITKRLLADPEIKAAFDAGEEGFERIKRANDRLYTLQKVYIDGDLAGRQLDFFRVFAERNTQVLRTGGFVGALYPSSFYQAAGAVGIRRRYLEEMGLQFCLSFENRKGIFEIHRSTKFALVVARAGEGPTTDFEAAFYRQDLDWLARREDSLRFPVDLVRRIGGEYLTVAEPKNASELRMIELLFDTSESFASFCAQKGIRWTNECHSSNDSWRCDPLMAHQKEALVRDPAIALRELVQSGHLFAHEGKTFHQFTDLWPRAARFAARIEALVDFKEVLQHARYPRLAFRKIARTNDERTLVAAVLPAGVTAFDSAWIERPHESPASISDMLYLLGVFNSTTADFTARLRGSANVTLLLVKGIPFPRDSQYLRNAIVSRTAQLALSSRQLASLRDAALRAPVQPCGDWGIGADAVLRLQAELDVLVALAYGLTAEQYSSMLENFTNDKLSDYKRLLHEAFSYVSSLDLDALEAASAGLLQASADLPRTPDYPPFEVKPAPEAPPTQKSKHRASRQLQPTLFDLL